MTIKRIKRKPKRIVRSRYIFQTLALVVIAALVIIVLKSDLETKKAENVVVVAKQESVSLPAPTRNIRPGEKLSGVDFMTIELPKGQATGHYINNIASYSNGYAKTALPKMLPIPSDAVTFEAVDNNMVVEGIPDGMRAITVTVDTESAVEGWARSGSYVDVILIRSALDGTPGLESKVIAENVRILSAGQTTTPTGSRTTVTKAPATITLLTSQEEALKIKTASGLGKLTFALRGIGDESPSQVVAMNQRKLLGETATAKSQRYTGYARDAEGRVFVLTSEKEWIRSKGDTASEGRISAIAQSSSTRGEINPIAMASRRD